MNSFLQGADLSFTRRLSEDSLGKVFSVIKIQIKCRTDFVLSYLFIPCINDYYNIVYSVDSKSVFWFCGPGHPGHPTTHPSISLSCCCHCCGCRFCGLCSESSVLEVILDLQIKAEVYTRFYCRSRKSFWVQTIKSQLKWLGKNHNFARHTLIKLWHSF